jgi:hypothetical protein
MSTTKENIQRWLERAKEQNATHLVVVCDKFDMEDFPILVGGDSIYQDIISVIDRYKDDPDNYLIMEVYNMSINTEPQLTEYRVWHV